MAKKTREEWLNELTDLLRPTFKAHKWPLPKTIRISFGYAPRRAAKVLGLHIRPENCKDGATNILISPAMDDAMEVAATLVHELCHAATSGDGHGKKFEAVARTMKLEGKLTATHHGQEFVKYMRPLLRKLGKLPHASVDVTAQQKKQTTRLIKVMCPVCEYAARITQKWIDIAVPVCPNPECGAQHCTMDVEAK